MNNKQKRRQQSWSPRESREALSKGTTIRGSIDDRLSSALKGVGYDETKLLIRSLFQTHSKGNKYSQNLESLTRILQGFCQSGEERGYL